jgi:queuine tRNA-ribosyltransferase
MAEFPFEVAATDGLARTGRLVTPRGAIRTPAFMPVGTAGTVKGLLMSQVREAGADIILGNTYHLMLRPGAERVQRLGGLHGFSGWAGPMLTDSGGFQVMSLAGLRKLTEHAVTFRSHVDGTSFELSPERSIEIQADLLGSDIVMQLDECVALPASRDAVLKALELSLRWGERCKRAFGERPAQALFGIVQGGTDPELRRLSATELVAQSYDGYAIGGLAVGEGHAAMVATIAATVPWLPHHRPRYLMGVGKPIDLIEAIALGVDMFDCVLPTRAGRHGQAWTWDGPINLKNARFAEDMSPLEPDSACPASRDYSRAYLHHLVKSEELLGQVLLSWHNVAFFQALMEHAREAIAAGSFAGFLAEVRARQPAPVEVADADA